jgi:hypothetical protein
VSKKNRNRNSVTPTGPGNSQGLFAAQRTTAIRQAPIPDPAELQRYREMDPALYDMIKREFEANGKHRREMQVLEARDRGRLVNAVTRNDTLGLVLAWTFAVGCVSVAVYFVATGKPVGALIGVLGLMPPIIGSIRGRRIVRESGEE